MTWGNKGVVISYKTQPTHTYMIKFTSLIITGVLAATQASHAVTISLYQFDGSTVDSVRGAAFDAQIVEGTIAYTQGRTGQALNFNGSTILRAPVAGAGLSAFSFSAWVNFQQYTTWASILKNWGGSQVGAFHLGLQEDESRLSSFLGNVNGGAEAAYSGPLSRQTWYHVGVTIGESQQRLYIDGQLINVSDTPGTLNQNFPFMSFGGKLDDGQQNVASTNPGWLNGYLDDVAFFNEELSGAQMSSVYTTGLAGSSINQIFPPVPVPVPVPVPEPSSTLALAGLLVGGMSLRRRK